MTAQRKILLGHLACYGDCLYATTVAKQIKTDYPGCHLTWAVGDKYKSVLDLNPHVDDVWVIPIQGNNYGEQVWTDFQKEARAKKAQGIFDEIILTQIPNDNWGNYDGTIRSATFNGYPYSVTVAVDPVIRLSDAEVEHVRDFALSCKLSEFKEVVLVECSPGSGQSIIDINLSVRIANDIIRVRPDICFVFSTHKKIDVGDASQIFQCYQLSFRENAELTKYCTLLLGGSSGITWLATSDWAKKLNTVQLLNRDYSLFAGVKYDFERWKLDSSSVIEITKNDYQHILKCLLTIFESGFKVAKDQFDEVYIPTYYNFRMLIQYLLFIKKKRAIPTVIAGYAKSNPHLNIRSLTYHAMAEVIRSNKILARLTGGLKSYAGKMRSAVFLFF